MRLNRLLEATESVVTLVQGDASVDISSLAMDSRKAVSGCLFMALPGTRVHGFSFLEDAVKRGASAVLVPEELKESAKKSLPSSFPILSARDVQRAAGLIAHAFFERPSSKIKVIGITGTNGKTTCSYIIEEILKAWGKKTAVSGTICQRIGTRETTSCLTTPDCIAFHGFLKEALDAGAGYVITEVSSHALHQGRVEGCRFEVALFTNLTRDHLDYHKDLEDYFGAKARLFTRAYSRRCVINLDDPHGKRLFQHTGLEKISFGLENEKADVFTRRSTLGPWGIKALIQTQDREIEINSSLIGRHNLSNILAAVSVAMSLAVPAWAIKKGVEKAGRVPGRLEPVSIKEKEGVTALVDYAHTPDAVRNILESLNEIKASGRIITVIGCGGDRDRGKRPEMALFSVSLSYLAVFTSDNPRTENPSSIIDDMLAGVPAELASRVRVIEDREEAIYWACSQARTGDIIVVAGKGHEDYQIIGGERRPFDDRKVLLKGLRIAAKAQGLLRQHGSFRPILDNVCRATGGEVADGFRFISFDSVSTDSRKIQEGALFWALRGERFNGNLFAGRALEEGAAAAVCEGVPEGLEGRPVVSVRDGLFGLGEFAAWYRRFLGLKTIAITGSCGKTTTKDLVFSVVSKAFKAGATRGNFNNLIGLPLTIFSMAPGIKWAVLEMGTNEPGEIRRLCQIARPEIGLITCVRPVHLEGLGSLENIAHEKGFVYESLPAHGKAIVNLDDKLVVESARRSRAKNVWGFGTRGRALMPGYLSHAVLVTGWNTTNQGLEVELDVDGEAILVRSRLFGRANVSNIAAAFCLGMSMGIPLEGILAGIRACPAPKGRMNVEEIKGWILVDDCYNANPSSMDAALGFVEDFDQGLGRNLILGDMLELGQDSMRFHQGLGERAASVRPSVLVAVGKMAEFVAQGALKGGLSRSRLYTFETSSQAAQFLRDEEGLFFNGTKRVVLLKGSRGVRLEEVALAIRQRLAEGI